MLGAGGSDAAASKSGNIKFLAVARAADGVLVASYTAQKQDFEADQYLKAVQDVLRAPDFQHKVTPGSRYRLVGDINAFNFTTDVQQRVYIAITVATYPERLVFPMINELIPKFKQDFGEKALTCDAEALSKKVEPMLAKLVKEYDDPTTKDRLAAVQSKVEDVKLSMHSNIDGMLRNLNKTEQIETDTERLQDQARLFDKQAASIKRREQFKNWKLTLIIGGIIAIILIIMIASLAKG
mmetsp:Transcript_8715/g.15291  ORF Transcript_8715/g.15291 Transcript_8715/m.15291 type:complete len:239 (+) Transcript_8715:236-952(+)